MLSLTLLNAKESQVQSIYDAILLLIEAQMMLATALNMIKAVNSSQQLYTYTSARDYSSKKQSSDKKALSDFYHRLSSNTLSSF